MTPKFATMAAWQQAELLMQPIFIRVIDNIRKELERSPWQGTYRHTHIWDDPIPEETRAEVIQLQEELAIASPERVVAIEATLAHLPQPRLNYELCLHRHNQDITVDLWQICYQICFRNYNPIISSSDPIVEVDITLFDEAGEVDWICLDTKAQHLIGQLFSSLPGE